MSVKVESTKKNFIKDGAHGLVRSVVAAGSGAIATSVVKSIVQAPANPVAAGVQAVSTFALALMIGDKTADHTIEKIEEVEEAVSEAWEASASLRNTRKEANQTEN